MERPRDLHSFIMLKGLSSIGILKPLIYCWILYVKFILHQHCHYSFLKLVGKMIFLLICLHLAHYSVGLCSQAFWFWACKSWTTRWWDTCFYSSNGYLWLCCPWICHDWYDLLYDWSLHKTSHLLGLLLFFPQLYKCIWAIFVFYGLGAAYISRWSHFQYRIIYERESLH